MSFWFAFKKQKVTYQKIKPFPRSATKRLNQSVKNGGKLHGFLALF